MAIKKQQATSSDITSEHLTELEASAINQVTANNNFYSIDTVDPTNENDFDEIVEKLNIEIEHTNNGMPSGKRNQDICNAVMSGMLVFQGDSGINVKPNSPRKNSDGKIVKYESVRGKGNQQLFIPNVSFNQSLAIARSVGAREEYADRSDFKSNSDAIDKGFWDWLIALDKPITLVVTEGAKKACSLISAGYLAIGLNGIWGWGSNVKAAEGENADKYGNKLDEQGKVIKVIHTELEPFLKKNVEIVWALDRDEKPETIKTVESAKKSFKLQCSKLVKNISDIVWEGHKGVDDLIFAEGVAAFKVAFYARSSKKALPKVAGKDASENKAVSTGMDAGSLLPPKNPPPLHISKDVFTELFKNAIRFDASVKQYWKYDGKGKWAVCSDEYIFGIVQKYLEEVVPKEFSPSYVRNVIEFARKDFLHEGWTEASNSLYIPFENGVLEFGTRNLLPHSPDYGFTWQLPRTYSDADSNWGNINNFLDQLCVDNKELKDIAIAFCAAILTGRSDLQKFLYLFGSGANGKGAFMSLLSMLVGAENTHSTTMADLNGNQFEASNLKGKRLVKMTDEDRRVGSLSVFKSATGQDSIRYERKGKDATNFKFRGMFVIAANSPTFVGDSNFAIKRRKVDFPCLAKIAENDRKDLTADFENDLTAFTTYLLSLPPDWVTATIRGSSSVPAVKELNWDMTIRENSIAAFYDEKLIIDPKGEVSCGELYRQYRSYCDDSGTISKGLNNFTPLLLELCVDSLGHSVEKQHSRKGKVIKGLRLRVDADEPEFIPQAHVELLRDALEPQVVLDEF
jgi:putative DNA primase/helicase